MKKTSSLNRFVPLICVVLGILFTSAMDGFNILTYNWDDHTAFIGKIHTIDYPVNTKTRGTITGHITFAEISYMVDGFTFTKDIVSKNLSVSNNKIEIRVSPKDHGMVTSREYHISLYGLYVIISFIFIVLSLIYLLKVNYVNQ